MAHQKKLKEDLRSVWNEWSTPHDWGLWQDNPKPTAVEEVLGGGDMQTSSPPSHPSPSRPYLREAYGMKSKCMKKCVEGGGEGRVRLVAQDCAIAVVQGRTSRGLATCRPLLSHHHLRDFTRQHGLGGHPTPSSDVHSECDGPSRAGWAIAGPVRVVRFPSISVPQVHT